MDTAAKEKNRQTVLERIFGREPKTDLVDAEEVHKRNLLRADFELVFMRHPRGQVVLAEIARICHFTSPATTTEDMVLQNAFKSILHLLGRWTDDKKGADELVERLLRE